MHPLDFFQFTFLEIFARESSSVFNPFLGCGKQGFGKVGFSS